MANKGTAAHKGGRLPQVRRGTGGSFGMSGRSLRRAVFCRCCRAPRTAAGQWANRRGHAREDAPTAGLYNNFPAGKWLFLVTVVSISGVPHARSVAANTVRCMTPKEAEGPPTI